MGNTLLRVILNRELALTERERMESLEESGAPRAVSSLESTPLETQIDQLYDEIRDLVAASAENPELKGEIERNQEWLHALQVEEAEAWKQKAESRRHLKPGEGYRLLKQATSLLES